MNHPINIDDVKKEILSQWKTGKTAIVKFGDIEAAFPRKYTEENIKKATICDLRRWAIY